MNHLLRHLAPITDDTWEMIDDEAKSRLSPALGARELVDFSGPDGWELSAVSTGRVGAVVAAPEEGVIAQTRQVLPLAEVRVDFALSRSELDSAARGAIDVDLSPLDDAAARLARVENTAVFDGWDALGIAGIIPTSPHPRVQVGDDTRQFVLRAAEAVATLRTSGVDGPYGIALDVDSWVLVAGSSDAGGSPLRAHLERVLGGPLAFAPGISAPVVLSMRGGDFVFQSGQDISIGYASHDANAVHLYLQETFTFRIATPEAGVAL
jgi:uncharacterized linocin/CFP29 family protein